MFNLSFVCNVGVWLFGVAVGCVQTAHRVLVRLCPAAARASSPLLNNNMQYMLRILYLMHNLFLQHYTDVVVRFALAR